MDTTAEAIFAHVAVRRRVVADLLAGLDDEQLARPSLCTGWSVRTVGAHLAEAAAPPGLGSMLGALIRARGRLHVVNDRMARVAGERPIAETVALLRERADSRFSHRSPGPGGR